ncbi:helix-turn-helix transcriptional regulator [Clostridium botulinum]|nr:helix-turn-helix transcriptional regulator [Clostridium botulinum]MBY6813367.1 helix-turn-helix transcriptional regulator [Clostridium botulinum]MBY6821899.1 helix-turn-helix transcriptional regulator [Clostridium botulinum]NFJ49972.1 helix-turn-helix transcriptional regulator [Clostridium botulinum]NFL08574.1 helix-turn-helix transcriptional regulator [Clostridium botulinum]
MNIIAIERTKQEISQSELARRCNFNASYISKIESGKKIPSPKAIKILSNALDICPVRVYIFFYLNNDCDMLKSNNMHCNIYSCTKCLEKE